MEIHKDIVTKEFISFYLLIEVQNDNFQTEEFTIPKLPITIAPEKLLNKIIYHDNKKGTVKKKLMLPSIECSITIERDKAL